MEEAKVNTTTQEAKQENQGENIPETVTKEPAAQQPTKQEPVTTDDILAEMTEGEKSWMGLSRKQYLADFDTLYGELENNYPYFGIISRKLSISIAEKYKLYRKQMKNCRDDDEFFKIVRAFIDELEYTGHIQVWGYRYFQELSNLKEFVVNFPQYEETLSRYIHKLDNPISQKNYQLMQEFYEKLDAVAEERNKARGNLEDNSTDWEETEASPNVKTKVLEKNKIAYVAIDAFDMGMYEQDKQLLLPFYEKVKNYENLVIDITQNGGGGMDYFNQLVVAPLAYKTYSVSTYLLAKAGTNNQYFLNLKEDLKKGIWLPVSQLPELDHINKQDIKQLDYFMKETYLIKPNNQSEFKGKIWLLVSSNNYSSAEYAAMFSKESGFATLVGEQTSGDGIGVDPAYIILPNSGMVVQYSPIYGITSDGRNSEEYGTEPDYYQRTGETALETCLNIIRSDKKP